MAGNVYVYRKVIKAADHQEIASLDFIKQQNYLYFGVGLSWFLTGCNLTGEHYSTPYDEMLFNVLLAGSLQTTASWCF